MFNLENVAKIVDCYMIRDENRPRFQFTFTVEKTLTFVDENGVETVRAHSREEKIKWKSWKK